jgi:hypothetical protein
MVKFTLKDIQRESRCILAHVWIPSGRSNVFKETVSHDFKPWELFVDQLPLGL